MYLPWDVWFRKYIHNTCIYVLKNLFVVVTMNRRQPAATQVHTYNKP